MKLNPPNAYQLELVRGCNMVCDFCGNYSLPKTKRFIEFYTAINIFLKIKEFGDKGKICFSMRGEPTLHPDLATITSACRQLLPRFQISLLTNGTTLSDRLIKNFLGSGGNIFGIDCYTEAIEKKAKKILNRMNIKTYLYGSDKVSLWNYNGYKLKIALLMPDIKSNHKVTRKFTNQCNTIHPNAYAIYDIKRIIKSLTKRCVKPFREVVIHYNGDVPLCCQDWLGGRKMFNMNSMKSFREYWLHDKKLNIIRRLLHNKIRAFYPCNQCNYDGGFYQGFLPDMGLLTDDEIIQLRKSLLVRQNCTSNT